MPVAAPTTSLTAFDASQASGAATSAAVTPRTPAPMATMLATCRGVNPTARSTPRSWTRSRTASSIVDARFASATAMTSAATSAKASRPGASPRSARQPRAGPPPPKCVKRLWASHLDRRLREGDDRADVEPGRLEAGVRRTLPGPVHPHGRLEEIQVSDLASFAAQAPGLHRQLECPADLLFARFMDVGEHHLDVLALEGPSCCANDRTVQRIAVWWHGTSLPERFETHKGPLPIRGPGPLVLIGTARTVHESQEACFGTRCRRSRQRSLSSAGRPGGSALSRVAADRAGSSYSVSRTCSRRR